MGLLQRLSFQRNTKQVEANINSLSAMASTAMSAILHLLFQTSQWTYHTL
jgi:hypothetical protein